MRQTLPKPRVQEPEGTELTEPIVETPDHTVEDVRIEPRLEPQSTPPQPAGNAESTEQLASPPKPADTEPIEPPIHPPTLIPIVDQFTYLGITIFPSLKKIASVNYMTMFDKIESDISRWMPALNTFQTRSTIIKMNILPRINYISGMIPLPQ